MMKFVILFIFFGVASTLFAEEPQYIGSDNCKMCHTSQLAGRQYASWRLTTHAMAFWRLSSPQAYQLARKLKLGIEPPHNPRCLKCHTTAYEQPQKRFMTSFHLEEGVGCEACHGPGSHYSRFDIMTDPARSRLVGLISIPDEKLCVQCHNAESPTFKGFDYRSAIQATTHARKLWDPITTPPTSNSSPAKALEKKQ